jgi:cation-dependent mannose-6-phosphate receptor
MAGRACQGTTETRLHASSKPSVQLFLQSRTISLFKQSTLPAMHSSIWYHLLAFGLPLGLAAAASDDSKGKKEERAPCTIRSPTSGAFFDLNPIHVILPDDPKKANKDARNESWSARGYDYGANFTLNFCGPVVENLTNVVGVDEARWQNVSAFYHLDGKTYSIG